MLSTSAGEIEASGRAPGIRALLAAAWRERGFGDFWSYTLVAEGAAEAMVEVGLKPWDAAAPFLLVEEAGGPRHRCRRESHDPWGLIRRHERLAPRARPVHPCGTRGATAMNELPTTSPTTDHHAADDATAAQTTDTNRRAQLLSTEHWSLLATRSMSWNEAFSRTSMFLSTLSASTVALALAGPAMSFGQAFPLFALVVLSVTLFLGLATYVRLLQVNNEDLYWVAGMNIIRDAYTRLSPGIENDFVTGHGLDPDAMARTFAAVDVTSSVSPVHMLVTTPAVVAVISSAIAGVMAGLIAGQLNLALEAAVVVGLVVFVVAVVGLIAYGQREADRYIDRVMATRGISTHPGRRSGG